MSTNNETVDLAANDGMALVGRTLEDKYRLEALLGSGGMCYVYRATHMQMGKQVAVKILKPPLAADTALSQRFEQEARAASRIHHPNAINVMDYGIGEGNTPFIVMEYVNGITLGELIRQQGALSLDRASNILRQICGALDAAHAVGVIHRDIKPDNIIIGDYGNSDWVEVVDFGVAKIREDLNRRVALTGDNVLVGTPRYMSPEQCEEHPVDARSDIYSLGVVLYEMLAGSTPFKWDSSTRLLVAHVTEPPEPLRAQRPDIPAAVEAVVMQALEKDPDRRPQSAGEFARMFEEAAQLGQPVRATGNRGGAFSRIQVPLGNEPPAATTAAVDGDDEATVVRPRPAALSRIDTPVDGRVNTPPAGVAADVYVRPDRYPGTPYVVATRDHRSSTVIWVAVIGVLIAAGIAAYLVFGNRWFGATTTREAIIDAQQSVTTALALVELLPKDHPLRTYSSNLREWQGELKVYAQANNNDPQVTQRAEGYRQKADDIAAQTRTALASLGREVPANINAPAPSSSASAGVAPPTEERPAGEAPANANRHHASANHNEADADEEEAAQKPEETPNANANRRRRAEPPAVEPVQSPDAPQNANRRKDRTPPKVNPVNSNENYE
ncbi:MAG TPA: serine/threonine-protein kinase [Blastocatellia bacterium]|nr:serine/threonine-protein kinase [Blastocatellia bacterium]